MTRELDPEPESNYAPVDESNEPVKTEKQPVGSTHGDTNETSGAVGSEETTNQSDIKVVTSTPTIESVPVGRTGVSRAILPKEKKDITFTTSLLEPTLEKSKKQSSKLIQPSRSVESSALRQQVVSQMNIERASQSVVKTLEPSNEASAGATTEVSKSGLLSSNASSVGDIVAPGVKRTEAVDDDEQVGETIDEQGATESHRGEVEELEDLFFEWAGGNPYTSRRPQVIVHEQSADGQSLALLQRALRDNYTFLRGGEPTAELASTHAGELRTTHLKGKIVTLNLADSKFSKQSSGNVPKIHLQQTNIVQKLVEWTETLYAGNLGYLIVSVPDGWNDKERGVDFVTNLRDHLAVQAEADGANIRAAKPRSGRDWSDSASQYFGVEATDAQTVAGVESRYKALTEREDWRSTALGIESGGDSDRESDEHYLVKSKIAETVAHRWYLEAGTGRSYDDFFTEAVLESRSRKLQTERQVGGDEGGIKPDIMVRMEGDASLVDGFESVLLGGEGNIPSFTRSDTIAVEYESGRGQAGTNFRKIRATLEKYEGQDAHVSHVFLVIPPAVLFTGPTRAHLVEQLVSTWSQQVEGIEAHLCVPGSRGRAKGYGTDVTLRLVGTNLAEFTHKANHD
ncbi:MULTISPECIES: hypothetical protein [unclassified Haloferax]|uniref:hypothetical protein n=1 Tax=unclassified Haloferax TaxID=2625095 RepID=UPI0028751D28|nr:MULTISPECIES: hypothetical protein [unclassified Haloferax]MDS0243646.1 hypothetical protein [Haloferax sp. S2CR25]MDS0446767.1 hypothetical protein [Haloferax sp. S2CR25-2]